MDRKQLIAIVLWLMLITILVTTFACGAEAITRQQIHQQRVDQDCGGWENFMQVVIEQIPDPTECIWPSNVVTETCIAVTIRVLPGDPDQCTFHYKVRSSKVDNLVKKYMQEYMP